MEKIALCIGINNYPGTDMDLGGCVNDANDWAEVLRARGYKVEALIDQAATLAAMRAGFQRVIGGAGKGDNVVITFSGHGTYAPDLDGDEIDGLDEALCPHDIRKAGPMLDDEIHEIFAARKPGVRLVLLSDSCHSGTVTRAAVHEVEDRAATRPRFLPMGNWMEPDKLPRGVGGKPLPAVQVTSGASPLTAAMMRRADDLLISGCREGPNNFSYDAVIKGRPNGAFTYYALKALAASPPGTSYAEWHKRIADFLPSSSYPQSPQIVGSAAARKRKVFG